MRAEEEMRLQRGQQKLKRNIAESRRLIGEAQDCVERSRAIIGGARPAGQGGRA